MSNKIYRCVDSVCGGVVLLQDLRIFILVGLFRIFFCYVLTFPRYILVCYTFGLQDCVRYNEDFVISRFCSINFTVTLAELENIVR